MKEDTTSTASESIVLKRNRVIINVWTSERNTAIPGVNVGHVSIQTPHAYMSLWPAARTENISRSELGKGGAIKRVLKSPFEARPPHYMASYENDVEAEDDTQATVRIALYSLDAGKLLAEFNRLKSSTKAWRLVGSNLLQQLNGQETKESCASFAYCILKGGGLHDGQGAKKTVATSRVSSIVTPDEMVKQLVTAKELELSKFPETAEWHFEGETILGELKTQYEGCGEKPSAVGVKPCIVM